jgi:hypothetical protein
MIASEEASDWPTIDGGGQNCGAGSDDAEELQDNNLAEVVCPL